MNVTCVLSLSIFERASAIPLVLIEVLPMLVPFNRLDMSIVPLVKLPKSMLVPFNRLLKSILVPLNRLDVSILVPLNKLDMSMLVPLNRLPKSMLVPFIRLDVSISILAPNTSVLSDVEFLFIMLDMSIVVPFNRLPKSMLVPLNKLEMFKLVPLNKLEMFKLVPLVKLPKFMLDPLNKLDMLMPVPLNRLEILNVPLLLLNIPINSPKLKSAAPFPSSISTYLLRLSFSQKIVTITPPEIRFPLLSVTLNGIVTASPVFTVTFSTLTIGVTFVIFKIVSSIII